MSLSSEPLLSARVLRETTRPHFTSFPSHLQATQRDTWNLVQVPSATVPSAFVCYTSATCKRLCEFWDWRQHRGYWLQMCDALSPAEPGGRGNIEIATWAFLCTKVGKRDIRRCCLNASSVCGNSLKSLYFPPLMTRCEHSAARDANACPPYNTISTFLAFDIISFVN